MEYEMYVIYDARSNKYSTPMCFDNDAVAIREIVTNAMKPYTVANTHPEDFIVYKIGVYNETDGVINSFNKPERICGLNDYIVKENN